VLALHRVTDNDAGEVLRASSRRCGSQLQSFLATEPAAPPHQQGYADRGALQRQLVPDELLTTSSDNPGLRVIQNFLQDPSLDSRSFPRSIRQWFCTHDEQSVVRTRSNRRPHGPPRVRSQDPPRAMSNAPLPLAGGSSPGVSVRKIVFFTLPGSCF
jgi:hypothetical protein